MFRLTLALAAGFAPLPASAQALSCSLGVPVDAGAPIERGQRRVAPIAGYTLALSWSPQYCYRARAGGFAGEAFQCDGTNRFGFVLHGLWPEGVGGVQPQYCRPVPAISATIARRHLCAMPSLRLMRHEAAKHGSCMSASPERYLAIATALYARVRYPDMGVLSRRAGLTAGHFAAAFARANGVDPGTLTLERNRAGWLEGVRMCLDLRLRAARCPGGGTPAHLPLRIWRERFSR